jgi:NAD(P)-dependent dehydrogenase (short-subunit alcohol dehydrogenase family)
VLSVSSGAEGGGTIDFDDVMYERPPYQGSTAYARSKLAQIFMTYDLAEEFRGSGVTFAAVNPGGYLDTDMVRERGGTATMPTEAGARFVVNAARSQETGAYFNEMEVDDANPQASDPEARRRLRELSMQLVGLD